MSYQETLGRDLKPLWELLSDASTQEDMAVILYSSNSKEPLLLHPTTHNNSRSPEFYQDLYRTLLSEEEVVSPPGRFSSLVLQRLGGGPYTVAAKALTRAKHILKDQTGGQVTFVKTCPTQLPRDASIMIKNLSTCPGKHQVKVFFILCPDAVRLSQDLIVEVQRSGGDLTLCGLMLDQICLQVKQNFGQDSSREVMVET